MHLKILPIFSDHNLIDTFYEFAASDFVKYEIKVRKTVEKTKIDKRNALIYEQ